MKTIGILGSTGSIGQQALDVIKMYPDKYKVDYLSCFSQSQKIIEQAKEFHPKRICVIDKKQEPIIVDALKSDNIQVLSGFEGLIEISKNKVDFMLNAIVGADGMRPSIIALENDITLGLANKESMVMAGWLISDIQKKKDSKIIPIDSEHNAIFQCLVGESEDNIKKIILTGSGGPFRTREINTFSSIKLEEALNHPNWEMGKKITIDSATMMNKGLEYIEAYWLFGLSTNKIDIIIHPQSIIHSMVEFTDGSIKAQLGEPDMRGPIQYALSYPSRIKNNINSFDFIKNNKFTFEAPDLNKFPCIKIAKDALSSGYSHQVVLNIANDLVVDKFLNKKIRFNDIPKIIEKCISCHNFIDYPNLDDIDSLSDWTKEYINKEALV